LESELREITDKLAGGNVKLNTADQLICDLRKEKDLLSSEKG